MAIAILCLFCLIIGFVLAAVFIALFIRVEARAGSPLLRLDLFRNRGFAVASLVAVIGMFAFLGTAYATSLRLGPIQHQSPLRTSVPFILLQGPTFVLIPLTSRLLERINPRWLLGCGLVVMAAGQFYASTMPISDGTLGAIALGQAAARFNAVLPSAGLPADQAAAAAGAARAGGPLAVNGIEPGQPGSAAHQLAFDALGHGYALGYVVCAAASLAAAILTVAALRGGRHDNIVRQEALIEALDEA